MTSENLICSICTGEAAIVREPREIAYGRRRVIVEDEFVRCGECGETYYFAGQMEGTDRKASEVARQNGEPPLPFEIRNLRIRLGLPQTEFERLLNTGPKTDVRWESGQVIPNAATGTLLRVLAAVPGAVRYLASLNNVELPPAYSGEAATDTVPLGDPRGYSVPVASSNVIPIQPYLARASTMQQVETRLSSESRTFRESIG